MESSGYQFAEEPTKAQQAGDETHGRTDEDYNFSPVEDDRLITLLNMLEESQIDSRDEIHTVSPTTTTYYVNDGYLHEVPSTTRPTYDTKKSSPTGADWDAIASRKLNQKHHSEIAPLLDNARKLAQKVREFSDDPELQKLYLREYGRGEYESVDEFDKKIQKLIKRSAKRRAKLESESQRITTHVEHEATQIDTANTPLAGYRVHTINAELCEGAKKKRIELPREIHVDELFDARLARDGVGMKIVFNDVNLARGCEKADLEAAPDTILIGSLDIDEAEEDDTPMVELGVLRIDDVEETLDAPVTATEISLDPKPSFTDTEGVLEMNIAFYTSLILSHELSTKNGIRREKNGIKEDLQHDRKVATLRTLGATAGNGMVVASGLLEVLPPTVQLIASSVMCTGSVGNAIYSWRNAVPKLDDLTDSEIIDRMERSVREEASELAREFPVISFENASEEEFYKTY